MVPQVKVEELAPLAGINPEKLYAAFGGGVEAFGCNFSIFCYRNTTIWIDIGAGFSNRHTPGLQKLLPNINLAAAFRPTAIILTHGHEDHIGAIPFLYNIIPARTRVYAARFTTELLKIRLDDAGFKSSHLDFQLIDENTSFEIGDFSVHTFFMPHSIPNTFSVGLHVKKLRKKIYFTSDFKCKGLEPRFSRKDIEKFGPVDYLFCDSTGSLSEGVTKPESEIGENLLEVIKAWQGRVFLTTFASQIERLRTIFDIAEYCGRKIGIKGYSILVNLRAAYNANEFHIDPSAIRNPPTHKKNSLWLVAGCQADVRSSFYRMARGEFSGLKFTKDDLLIYSASMIPGNEDIIYESLNKVAATGAKVLGVSNSTKPMHTSGHGKREDLLQIFTWLKPRCIIPVHGDPLHFQYVHDLVRNDFKSADLADVNSGRFFELSKTLKVKDELEFKLIFIENGELHSEPGLYKKRVTLSQSGICNIILSNENKQLLKIDYVAVCSDKLLKEKFEMLKSEIASSLASTRNSMNGFSEKKFRQKTASIHKKILLKEPFLNIIYIKG